MGDGAWDLQAERREENPLRGERRTPPRRKKKPPEEKGKPPLRRKENSLSPLRAPREEPQGPRLGTHVGADLGHSGAQVEHGGDGADGKSNDFSPGERLQGRDRDSSCAQSPSTATPSLGCAQLPLP